MFVATVHSPSPSPGRQTWPSWVLRCDRGLPCPCRGWSSPPGPAWRTCPGAGLCNDMWSRRVGDVLQCFTCGHVAADLHWGVMVGGGCQGRHQAVLGTGGHWGGVHGTAYNSLLIYSAKIFKPQYNCNFDPQDPGLVTQAVRHFNNWELCTLCFVCVDS